MNKIPIVTFVASAIVIMTVVGMYGVYVFALATNSAQKAVKNNTVIFSCEGRVVGRFAANYSPISGYGGDNISSCVFHYEAAINLIKGEPFNEPSLGNDLYCNGVRVGTVSKSLQGDTAGFKLYANNGTSGPLYGCSWIFTN